MLVMGHRIGMGNYLANPYGAWIDQGLTEQQSSIRTIPSWCNWMPFADHFDACQPYTAAELRAMTHQDLKQIRRVNPALAQAAEARINQVSDEEIREHPERYADLLTYWENPEASRWVGPGAVRDASTISRVAAQPGRTLTMWALAAMALVALIGSRKG